MGAAVRAMVNKSLRALSSRNVELAGEVLESDDVVDSYRDRLSERLLTDMTQDPTRVDPNMQLVLATRYLERIAEHRRGHHLLGPRAGRAPRPRPHPRHRRVAGCHRKFIAA